MKHDERECMFCGVRFVPEHGNRRMCPECYEVVHMHKNRNLPRSYEGPANVEVYEKDLRERMAARFKDNIVATGYADRQRAETLRMVGKVKVEL